MSRPSVRALLPGLALAAFCAQPGEAGEVLVPHAFVVHVATSPKAQARLGEIGEKVKVLAVYAAPPLPAHRAKAKEGEIELGPKEDAVLPAGGGTARFKGEMSKTRIGWVTEAHLLVNVVSARLKHPDNLLSCTVFDAAIERAQKRPIEIGCKLIGE